MTIKRMLFEILSGWAFASDGANTGVGMNLNKANFTHGVLYDLPHFGI